MISSWEPYSAHATQKCSGRIPMHFRRLRPQSDAAERKSFSPGNRKAEGRQVIFVAVITKHLVLLSPSFWYTSVCVERFICCLHFRFRRRWTEATPSCCDLILHYPNKTICLLPSKFMSHHRQERGCCSSNTKRWEMRGICFPGTTFASDRDGKDQNEERIWNIMIRKWNKRLVVPSDQPTSLKCYCCPVISVDSRENLEATTHFQRFKQLTVFGGGGSYWAAI